MDPITPAAAWAGLQELYLAWLVPLAVAVGAGLGLRFVLRLLRGVVR